MLIDLIVIFVLFLKNKIVQKISKKYEIFSYYRILENGRQSMDKSMSNKELAKPKK